MSTSSSLIRLVTLIAFLVCGTVDVLAIRPVIIMFYGEGLERPIYITNSQDTMAVHDANNPTSLRVADMGNRKYLSVAMFWGPKFSVYPNGEHPLSELRPADAGQHGRLYPATATEPAVLLQTIPRTEPQPIPQDMKAFVWGGRLAQKDVDILIRYGVLSKGKD